MLTSCEDGLFGKEESTEQGGNGKPEDNEIGEEGDANQNTVVRGPISLTVADITATTAVFLTKIDVDKMADYTEVGFVFSNENNFDVDSESVIKVKVNKEVSSEMVKKLTFGTRYYYTVYLLKNNIYQYGDIKEFTTEDLVPELSVESSSITVSSASISGNVTFMSGDDRSQFEVGVAYSSSEKELNSNESTKVAATLSSTDTFSIDLSELNHSTKYYYCSYVKQNSRIAYGQTKDFTTIGLPDLKLEDIKTEVEVMTVTITGKIAGIEDVDISKVSLECSLTDCSYNSPFLSSVCDQITVDGEFRFVFEMNCKESLVHNVEYSYDLSISYDSNSIGNTVYGSFHTYVPKGSVTLSAVSCNSAEFVGTIEDFAELNKCPSKTPDGKFQVGIYYSQDPNDKPNAAKKKQGVLNDDGTFTVSLNDLIPETSYYWGLVIAHNTVFSRVVFGEVNEFRTLKFDTSPPSGDTNPAHTSSAN